MQRTTITFATRILVLIMALQAGYQVAHMCADETADVYEAIFCFAVLVFCIYSAYRIDRMRAAHAYRIRCLRMLRSLVQLTQATTSMSEITALRARFDTVSDLFDHTLPDDEVPRQAPEDC
jgi:exosortase/archaeosortase